MNDSLENEMLRLSDMRENPELTPESVLTFRNGFRLCHNIMIKKQEHLEAENARLKEALKYYSDEMHWREHWFRLPFCYSRTENNLALEFKGWEVAQKALEECGGENG